MNFEPLRSSIRGCKATPTWPPGATIIVTVVPVGRGRYDAYLAPGDRIVTASRIPFLDAARALLKLGVPPEARFTLRHEGSATNSLTGTVGEAARWAVEERDQGSVRFVPWKAFPPSSGGSPIASTGQGGTPPVDRTNPLPGTVLRPPREPPE